MKDPILEFSEIDNRIDEIFGFLKNRGKTVNKNINPYPSQKNVSSILDKHRREVESGDECAPFKTKPNELFWSATGAKEAEFGKSKNKVSDISELRISKRELRCYDIKNDPSGIAWLFANDARFEAEKIWGNPKEIYFKGKWMGGEFKGIMVPGSEFEGGRMIPPGRWLQAKKPKNIKGLQTGVFELPINQIGLALTGKSTYGAYALKKVNVAIYDASELGTFKSMQNDFITNEFSKIVWSFKKLVHNGIIDGYGNFPALKYMFGPNKGLNYKNLSQKEAMIMEYFSDLKVIIIDNIVVNQGGQWVESPELQEKFTTWIKGKIAPPPPQIQTFQQTRGTRQRQKFPTTLKELVSECLKTA